jgi:hypothetical protein
MPGLQLHQLRVAAVAKLIGESFQTSVDVHSAVVACLFHDMGNIIKTDLTVFPELLEPGGAEYWQGVKNEFIAKYGENAHRGNVAIAKEINLPERVVELIDGVSFSNIQKIVEGDDWEQKISEYADDRAGPHGILSAVERLAEARTRYVDSGKSYYTPEGFERLAGFVSVLEEQIFAKTRIKPQDINDASVAPLIEELRNYPV